MLAVVCQSFDSRQRVNNIKIIINFNDRKKQMDNVKSKN